MADRTFGQALGELIYQKRKAVGLTQVQLAEDAYGDAGRTRRISELENGTVANPHPKTIDPIIATLGISEDELAECARRSGARHDDDLDRAYREARNLIDAIARQFEHSKPSASLAELDDFLRSKAKEWSALRTRIAAIDTPQTELLHLRSEAANALSEGDFDQVDRLLSRAEDSYQKARTLQEIRKFAEIRITRGDSCLLRGNPTAAQTFYLSAAEFFRPFDELEMAACLTKIAAQVYEVARRSLDPAFLVAARLLETLIEIPSIKTNPSEIAAAHYRLGLIYRSECDRSPRREAAEILDKAILYSRQSSTFLDRTGPTFESISAAIGLANCLWHRGQRLSAANDLREAIETLEKARANLGDCSDAAELLPHICNSLGIALMDLHRLIGSERDASLLDRAIEAFNAGVRASEDLSNAEGWGAAKSNIGALLAEKAQANGLDEGTRDFLRVRAIAELSAALETSPSVAFPIQFGQTQLKLGNVLREHAISVGEPLGEFYLSRALNAYEAAASVYSEDRDPERWAHIALQMGSIFAFHARLDGVKSAAKDFEQAAAYFRKVLPILREMKDESAVNWAARALERAEADLAGLRAEDA